jgi:hypothetical protein
MTPEAKIKELVKRGLKTLTYCHGNWPVQNGMGTQMLDWHGCVGRQYVAIETKAPGKKPTPRQELTIENIRACGGLAFVVSSVDEIDKMMAQLRERDLAYMHHLDQVELRGS